MTDDKAKIILLKCIDGMRKSGVGHAADGLVHALQAIEDRVAFLRAYDDAEVSDPVTILGSEVDAARRHMEGKE